MSQEGAQAALPNSWGKGDKGTEGPGQPRVSPFPGGQGFPGMAPREIPEGSGAFPRFHAGVRDPGSLLLHRLRDSPPRPRSLPRPGGIRSLPTFPGCIQRSAELPRNRLRSRAGFINRS